MQKGVFVMALLSLLSACDPCTGCGPISYDPTVELAFVDVEFTLNQSDELVKTETPATDVTIFWDDLAIEIPTTTGNTSHTTPLRNQNRSSAYTIAISNNSFELELIYDLFEVMDVDHRMLIRAYYIAPETHTFDSLAIECITPDCLDKQTTITCYY